jgi:hypothetical protein
MFVMIGLSFWEPRSVGEKHNYGTSSDTGTGTAVGSGSGCWSKMLLK